MNGDRENYFFLKGEHKFLVPILLELFQKSTGFTINTYLFPSHIDSSKRLAQKSNFLQLKCLVDKTTCNFHSFNKINDFDPFQYAAKIFYLFYINPQS